ncbi:hypothetical protein [Micromonospora globbae]|uniref:hypothetical protein n=1 Tax=Micromonospora globbae TaxID=1894969 RepID=UPI0011C344F9|nr:hypothetical protein [Micromonospora globbae]
MTPTVSRSGLSTDRLTEVPGRSAAISQMIQEASSPAVVLAGCAASPYSRTLDRSWASKSHGSRGRANADDLDETDMEFKGSSITRCEARWKAGAAE